MTAPSRESSDSEPNNAAGPELPAAAPMALPVPDGAKAPAPEADATGVTSAQYPAPAAPGEKLEPHDYYTACNMLADCRRELAAEKEKKRPYSDKLAQEVIAEQVKDIARLTKLLQEARALSARPASDDEGDDVTGERRYSHATAIAYAQHLEKKLAKVKCSDCRGEGSIQVRHQHPTESYGCYTETVECGSCKGTGLRGPDNAAKREGP